MGGHVLRMFDMLVIMFDICLMVLCSVHVCAVFVHILLCMLPFRLKAPRAYPQHRCCHKRCTRVRTSTLVIGACGFGPRPYTAGNRDSTFLRAGFEHLHHKPTAHPCSVQAVAAGRPGFHISISSVRGCTKVSRYRGARNNRAVDPRKSSRNNMAQSAYLEGLAFGSQEAPPETRSGFPIYAGSSHRYNE